MTNTAELQAWNADHPMGTHVRWVDDKGAVHSGRTMGPARFVAGTLTAVVKISDQAELRDIGDLSTMPKIETVNDFMVGTNGAGISVMRHPQGMDKEQALRLAAWLVMLADNGQTERFAAIFDAIKGT
jgi:hypothetical protein